MRIFLLFIAISQLSLAQTSPESNFPTQQLSNFETTQILGKGQLQVGLSHRFGSINEGVKTFFGFDESNGKISFNYGLGGFAQLSIARESIRKTYSSGIKFTLWRSKSGVPIELSGYTSVHLNTELDKNQYPKMVFYDRLSYASQLLASIKAGQRFSFLIAPTFVRQNLVLEHFQNHNQYIVAGGVNYTLNESFSMSLEYAYNFNRHRNSIYSNPLGFGLNYTSKNTTFQLMLGNAQSTSGPGYLSNANGRFLAGNIHLGFNLLQTLKLK